MTVNRQFALVTGASSGIGYELARQFAQHNYDLLIVSDSDKIKLAEERLKEFPVEVKSIQADLVSYAGVEELYAYCVAQDRPLDAVAINAGIGVSGEFLKTSFEEEQNLISLNITSAVHLAKRILPSMVAHGKGKILFTSSIAATMPGPYMAVYAASKSFLLSFSEALRYELKDKGIKVTALMPGPTDTNFFQRAGMENTEVGQSKKDDPAQVARQGFEALMDDDDKVIAGSLKTRMQNVANDLMPETTKAKIHASMAKPKTANG